MSPRPWAKQVCLAIVVAVASGCGASNQPRGSGPPTPSAEERAKLKADYSNKMGTPVSKKSSKGRR